MKYTGSCLLFLYDNHCKTCAAIGQIFSMATQASAQCDILLQVGSLEEVEKVVVYIACYDVKMNVWLIYLFSTACTASLLS